MEIRGEKLLQGGSGCVLAILIGLLTVGLFSVAAYLLHRYSFNLREEWEALLRQTVIVASPFGFLALFGLSTKTTWITALMLTAVLWSLYVADALLPGAVGANIGLGLLMMASPLGIVAGALAVNFAVSRLRRK